MRLALWSSTKVLLVLSLILGVFYPLSILLVGQVFFNEKANGSFIIKDGTIIGSSLLAQKFSSAKYFWSRPSATDFGTVPSGASNLGPTSAALKASIEARKNQGLSDDLLFASGSGLDPHISMNAALSQLPRIVQIRDLSDNQTEELKKLIERMVEGRDLGFLGEERIHVLRLNLALDQYFVN